MLWGRAVEQQQVDALLHQAREGLGGTVVVRGEPGIGKTALCRYARSSAEGFRVVSTQGVEAEATLGHAGLFDVLHRLQEHLPGLPRSQRSALANVLRLEDGPQPDALTVGVATLGLLSIAAAQQPLLVLVDDLQWVDSASRAALLFAARRLSTDAVSFLVAVRRDDPLELTGREVALLDLEGLDAVAVGALVEQCRGRPVAVGTAERLVALTGGNPLAIEELAPRLTDAELRGDVPIDPARVADLRANEHFRDQVAALPGGVRTALLLGALSGSTGVDQLTAAIATLGGERGDLLGAEASGLVSLDAGTVAFRHPLVRAAVVGSATAAERRAAHAALATTAVTEVERLWHRAEAVEGTDGEIAAELESLAVEAERIGGYVEAQRAWDRAVALTPAGDDVARRLLGAGRVRHLAGRSAEALPLLDEALERAQDPAVRLAVQQERGHILVWQGEAEVVHRSFLDEARRSVPEQPFLASSAFVLATLGALQTGNLADAEEAAAAAHEQAQAVGGLLGTVTAAIHGMARSLRGDFGGEAALLALDGCAEEALPMADIVPATLGILSWAGMMLTVAEAYDAAERVLGSTVAFARDRRAIAALPAPLVNWSELRCATGDWETSAALADEALQLAEATGEPAHRLRALINLGTIDGLRGRSDRAAEQLTEALVLARERRLRSYELDAQSALGQCALAAGDLPAALRHLRRSVELAGERGLRHPYFTRFVPDLVEAELRAGNADAAEAALAPFERDAAESMGSRGRAVAARARGMCADDRWERHFDRALGHHEDAPVPFEQARTHLSYGERLRRSGERRRARHHLRSALGTFQQLGAQPWAERARDELRASGARVSPADQRAAAALTPQELRIARAVARGHTNREVAADLFVSPKTVENQLTRIYAKLGVRSRTELAAQMAVTDGPTAVA